MDLKVDGDILTIDGEIIKLDDLFSKEFYEYSNSKANNYLNNTWYVNELFIGHIQNTLAIDFFLKKNQVTRIDATRASKPIYTGLQDLARIHAIEFKRKYTLQGLTSGLKFHLEIITSFIFLVFAMLRIKQQKGKNFQTEYALVRTPAARGKIGNLDIQMETEDFRSSDSIYRVFKRRQRIAWCFHALTKSFYQYRELRKIIIQYFGRSSVFFINQFYGKRLVHANLYHNLLESLFKNIKTKVFYTANNLDRYAFIEEELTKKHNVKLICIPHGLEYGYRFPKCFTGDVFYATSKRAATYFNDLYKTNKFVFDLQIITSIFKSDLSNKIEEKSRKIVFFTESRDVEVNHQIIEGIIPLLNQENLKISLKLHPKDNKEDYFKYNLEILEDFDLSISNNICFARKSTTLLEAIYNNSSSAAILLNKKDESIFETFPSLQSDSIKKTRSMEELKRWIVQQQNKVKSTEHAKDI